MWWRRRAKEKEEYELEEDRLCFRHIPEQTYLGAAASGVYPYQMSHGLTHGSGAVAESFAILGGACETSPPSRAWLGSVQGLHQGTKQSASKPGLWKPRSLNSLE